MFWRTRQSQDPGAAAADEQLRLANAIYQNVQEGVVITDPCGRIVAINPAFTAISDFSEHELLARHVRLLRSRRHSPAFYTEIRRMLLTHGSWEGEMWNRRRSGEVFPQWVRITSVIDSAGDPTFFVGVITDVSRMRQAPSQLHYMAHHDSLTGLPNRATLHVRLRHSIKRAVRLGERCAVLFLDLDGFKRVNDSKGHAAGDELLRQVAARLKSHTRDTDILARLGGDEFVLVMEDPLHRGDAARMAESLMASLSAPFTSPCGEEVKIGASVGISLCPEDGAEADALLYGADRALYEAKAARGRSWKFHEGVDEFRPPCDADAPPLLAHTPQFAQ